MKLEELEDGMVFYFKKHPTEDYIVNSVQDNVVGYYARSGTHTFAACAIKSHFLEITEKTVVKHYQV